MRTVRPAPSAGAVLRPSGESDQVARDRLRHALFRPVRIAATVAAALLAGAAIVSFTPGINQPENLFDLLAVVGSTFALIAGVITARRSHGSVRKTWFWFCVWIALWLIGDLSWAVAGIVGWDIPAASVVDIPYVAGYLPAVAALLSYPAPATERGSRTRGILDILVLSFGLTLTAYVVSFEGVVDFTPSYTAILLAFYPLADIALAGLALILVLRRARAARLDLLLLSVGFVLYAAADAVYSLLAADGGFYGSNISGLFYTAAPLLFGLAAMSCNATSGVPEIEQRTVPHRVAAMVPDLVVWAALIMCVAAGLPDWMSVALALLTIALTAARQVVLVGDDLTLRRDLETRVADRTAALEQLADGHQRLLESVGEGILGVDRDGLISFLNPAAERMLDLATAEVAGQDACATLNGGVARSATHECLLRGVIATGETARMAGVEYARRDGSRFEVEMTASPEMVNGVPAGVVVVFRDITDRMAVERMQREFVIAVSHELRTPLTAMRGSLEMLADGEMGELPELAQRAVDLAMRGSERLTRLVVDILDAERLALGMLPLVLGDYDVDTLVDTACRPLQHLGQESGITLVVDPLHARVRGDADRVVQALTNLVGNALKFSGAGSSIRISAATHDGWVRFTVADEGRGIPARARALIFERFHQVDVADALGGGGTGLGLAITRGIVEQHGGRIWVESEEGVGSSFHFTIPAARETTLVETPVRTPVRPPVQASVLSD